VYTPGSFRRFLTWLDEGGDSGAERYLEMRRRLVAFFERKRCDSPEDLADETLNRVCRRLEEKGAIVDASPASYCYVVAKFVFLEYLREAERQRSTIARMTDAQEVQAGNVHGASTERARDDRRHLCLDRCLGELTAPDRQLILDYYQGEQRAKIDHRRVLAARLDISPNALSIRACRLRARLEGCVKTCTERE
jgi:RNA polymerase sigma factor (sigma-70 family)